MKKILIIVSIVVGSLTQINAMQKPAEQMAADFGLYAHKLAIIKNALWLGSNINQPLDENNNTALHMAVDFYNMHGFDQYLIKMLIQARAYVDKPNKLLDTPFMRALKLNLPSDVIAILLEGKPDLVLYDGNHMSVYDILHSNSKYPRTPQQRQQILDMLAVYEKKQKKAAKKSTKGR